MLTFVVLQKKGKMHKPLLILMCGFGLFSCKKETTTWSTNWSAPIAYGTLTLDDLVDTSNQYDNDDGYLSVIYNESVFSFSIDTLVQLPDTTVVAKSSVGIPSLNVSPGFVYSDTYDQDYNLGEIELKEVMLKEGNLNVTIKSPWSGKSTVSFNFPTVTKLGVPLAGSYDLDAGSSATPSEATDVIDLSNYLMDLTGADGNLINAIYAELTMGSNEESTTFNITNYDSVAYEIQFEGLKPSYARGYFGSYYFSDTTGIKLDFMDNVSGGTLDLDSLRLDFNIRNGFNIVAQARVTKVTGINSKTGTSVDLSFPLLGSMVNINPAAGGYYDFIPTYYPFAINNNNSNVLPFIENLCDSIVFGYELFINPDGNISGGHDEVFPGSTLDLVLDGEFPLHFGASGITLSDTLGIDYSIEGETGPRSGEIVLAYTNGFPLQAVVSLELLDEFDTVLEEINGNSPMSSGSYDNLSLITSPAAGSVIFEVDEASLENLKLAEKMIVYVTFETEDGNKIKITSDAFIDFNLKSNLNVQISL